MTKALIAALGTHYQTAVIAANSPRAVTDLAAALAFDPTLAEEAREYHATLSKFAKSMGGIDKMKNRDFAGATHLQGLTEALAQL